MTDEIRYGKAVLENGQISIVKARSIPQSQMSSECWLIQFRGPEACRTCEFKGKSSCGGKKIRKIGKNEKDFIVPLGTEIGSGENGK